MDDTIKVISMIAAFIGGLAQAYMSAREIRDYCATKKDEQSKTSIENTTSQTQET